MKESIVHVKAFDFALSVIDLYKELIRQHEYVLSKQLLRCGTSIGANLEEARSAQTRPDFLSKITISSKEARETRYWLRLLQSSSLADVDVSNHITQIDEIIRLLTAITKTIVTNK